MPAQSKHVYDSSYWEILAPVSRSSANRVVPIVNRMIQPKSILDVGCGVGTWLAEWTSQGVTDIVGLDGQYTDTSLLQIESSSFMPVDLQKTFSLDRKFDLVECLEVAEHLDESCSDTLIESLSNHGDIVMFSAAIPGQGGTNHVNEQWPSYWIEKFSRAGFKVYDAIRPLIWDDARIEVWYRQNVLLFSRDRIFGTAQASLDLVHPELWKNRIDHQPHPRELVRALPGATMSAVRRRLQSRR